MARTNPESLIQSAICDYLTLRGVFFIRLNNIPALYRDGSGALQFRKLGKYARPGLADLLVIVEGRAIFIEVKGEKGKQSPDQIEFEEAALKSGAQYYVMRSVDDVQEAGL